MLYNDYIPKMCAGMRKNAYQHKVYYQIYILESNQRNYKQVKNN